MKGKKEARPLVAQETGQDEIVAFDGAAFSKSNFNTSSEKTQTAIYDLLPHGEANAIPSRQLVELVGASSVRELQSRIAGEREAGAMILSTCKGGGGYFKPSDGTEGRAEIERYIRTLLARALNTLRALSGAKAALASDSALEGQIDFEEMEALF